MKDDDLSALDIIQWMNVKTEANVHYFVKIFKNNR